ncbi:sodium- and chloride-dependent glycine transporter 1-like [Anneissia japonica]|uniref:sodium- and chloride-dependent glycine transporter 1-like n=1 Tax=Anneissia japonica TaxID=1529436 RepID=UPI0014257209|nr:sodium- and chloride-dependent glycine transporter 1-like [Anneissia japonica]
MTSNSESKAAEAVSYASVPASDEKSNGNEEENTIRGNWGKKLDFMLSCIGYAVGLGNIWRFPYLAYSNGGGAFLFPYIIMLLCAGLPLFFLELSFGQFASLGAISIWKISPIFKGLGWGMTIITAMVCCYYNTIIAYIIFYLFASMTSELPWATCGHEWNTDLCSLNGTLINENGTHTHSNDSVRPSIEYWNKRVLHRSSGIEELGSVRWDLCLCLLLAWIVVFLCIAKGVKSSGKVVYFTATFPYIVLLILFFRGITLPGAFDGILYFVKPNFTLLKDPKVWKDAASQIFYSLGVAWGSLHTLSSYNKFHNNCHRDALIVAFTNCGTSIFAGFVIFSVIGFMAHDAGLDISKVASNGPGLAFVAYPEAVARMPYSPLWSFLFFFMLFTLGLDSQFVMMETVITAFCDELSTVIKDMKSKKIWFTLGFCVVGFLLGIPHVTEGGIYLLTLMDNYSAGFSLLLIAFVELIVICYVYGISRYTEDISIMLGFTPNIYWKVSWLFITPLVTAFIFVFFCVGYAPLKYEGEYEFPPAAEALGWLMVIASLVPTPLIAGLEIYKSKGSLLERVQRSAQPDSEWGPFLNKHRRELRYPEIEGRGDYDENTVPLSSPPSYYTAINCVDSPV